MTGRNNGTSWPLTPDSKTSGAAVSGAVPGQRQQIARAQLQAGLAPRPWQITVVNNGSSLANFFVEYGDDFGTSRSVSPGAEAMLQIQDVPPFGGVPVAPFVGNFWTLTVTGTHVTVYGSAVAAFTIKPNLFCSMAPQASGGPVDEVWP
jgi:hypothetical protein